MCVGPELSAISAAAHSRRVVSEHIPDLSFGPKQDPRHAFGWIGRPDTIAVLIVSCAPFPTASPMRQAVRCTTSSERTPSPTLKRAACRDLYRTYIARAWTGAGNTAEGREVRVCYELGGQGSWHGRMRQRTPYQDVGSESDLRITSWTALAGNLQYSSHCVLRSLTSDASPSNWADIPIKVRIARKGIESSEKLGRHRWVVERTLAWLGRYRRLSIRYERRGDIHEAFLHLGCALICLNYLK